MSLHLLAERAGDSWTLPCALEEALRQGGLETVVPQATTCFTVRANIAV